MYKVRTREMSKYGITPEEAAVLLAIQAIGDEATPLPHEKTERAVDMVIRMM